MTESAIVVQENTFLAPAITKVDTMLVAYQIKNDFIKKVLRQDVDFGPLPGGSKPALLKPGAEKMANLYGLSPRFEDVVTIEDWIGLDHNGEPFFYYRQRCNLWKNGMIVASADGSCNSWEKKYRYRQADRVCPKCGKATIFKSKKSPGFFCWDKKGGCGANFRPDDKDIINQEVGLTKNPDVAEQVNTILKMAQKRALVAATLIATCASDYFTQDVEDFIDAEIHEIHEPPAPVEPPITAAEVEKPITKKDFWEYAQSIGWDADTCKQVAAENKNDWQKCIDQAMRQTPPKI